MEDPQTSKRNRTLSEKHTGDDCSKQPSDYYYDDSTGYETYKEDEKDKEDEEEETHSDDQHS